MSSILRVNEQALLDNLQDTRTPRTPAMIRQLNGIALLAAHDRKVTHEFFAGMLDASVEIDILLSALEGAGAMRYCLLSADETRQPVLIDEQIDVIMKNLMRQRAAFAEKLELVTQCPGPDDKIS